MCEYALRKHSESTGRVPRRLASGRIYFCRRAVVGGSRDGTQGGSARPGRVECLAPVRPERIPGELSLERASRRARAAGGASLVWSGAGGAGEGN